MGKKKKSKQPQGRRFRWEEELKYNYRHYIQAAERHLETAKELFDLSIKNEEKKYDPDYPLQDLDVAMVRASGHVAWMAVLLASMAYFKKHEDAKPYSLKKDFQDVKEYRKWFSKFGRKKLMDAFNELYEVFHLQIGYDGNIIPIDIYPEFKKITTFIAQIKSLLR